MAESSSPALPGDVEWLPGPGGTWVLRIHPASAQSPALILRVLGGGERRIEPVTGPATEYAIPAELDWSAAWLQWPDGTRAALPLPHGPHAEVIELRPRRFARGEPAAAPREDGWRGEIAPPVREALEARSRSEHESPAAEVTQDAPSAAESAASAREEAQSASPAAATGALGVSRDEAQPASPAAESGSAEASPAAESGSAEVSPAATAGAAEVSPAATAGAAEVSQDGADELAAPESTADVGGASWTTPPQHPDSSRDAEVVWRERRDDLRRELSEAADAIARARDGERFARDAVLTALAAARADLRASRAAREADASALAAITGELGAERAAHAVTRGSVGTLADALSTARAELAAAKTRSEATRADLAVARAELAAAKATGAADLAGARSEATQARAEAASLREALEAERALRERPMAGRGDLGRLAREQAEVAAAARRSPEASTQLLANLDAAAAALRAATPEADAGPSAAESASIGLPSGAASGRASEATSAGAENAASGGDATASAETVLSASVEPTTSGDETAPADPSSGLAASAGAPTPGPSADAAPAPTSSALVAPGSDRRLRRALVALAREDGVAAGALLVGLLPSQGAVIEGALTYDLTVRGVGTFAVFVTDGSARIVRLSRRRPRGQALFHLSAEPCVLAELLAGERGQVRRLQRKARLSGRRKRARELLLLADAKLSLADAVKAGARLEPGLVYRALPLVIDPEWTRGHTFTVAQQIVEFAPHAWHVSARDGQPLRVAQHHSDAPADATVTMSQAAFERMLRNEAPVLGDRPQIRGDREAVAALKRWTDIARGV